MMIVNRTGLIGEVYKEILPEMARHEIPDTTDNRITFLLGLLDGWKDQRGGGPNAYRREIMQAYMSAVNFEITMLKLKVMFDPTSDYNIWANQKTSIIPDHTMDEDEQRDLEIYLTKGEN